jgi:hypothetical protein
MENAKQKSTGIIRRPDFAGGGITEAERARMAEHSALWIKRAFRTERIEPEKIIPAIKGLYAAAGLKEPRGVIVPSPLVMAFAYGAAAAIWHERKTGEKRATLSATRSATDSATYSAEEQAALACVDMAGRFGLECARRWAGVYQGGNMWAGYDCYLTACRDVLGLELREHQAYAHWEQAAIHGGFRVMHEEFCIVSDFPELLRVDENSEPHCENGPSHRWRDGWVLYHWHGVRVPAHWIENKDNLDPAEVLRAENVEQRAAGAAIIGWAKIADRLNRKVIDGDPDTDLGALVELTLPGLPEPGRFLMAKCPRNGTICEGVPRVSDIDNLPINTVIAAQAWRIGDPQSDYIHPPKRT